MTNPTSKNDPNNRSRSDVEKELRTIWLGRRDSNPRMPVPKTGALPLGHSPSLNSVILSALDDFHKLHLMILQ